MREHLVAQKVGNRSGISQGRRAAGEGQRPTKRDRAQGARSFVERLKGFAGYAPAGVKLALGLVVVTGLFTGYRSAASATFFEIKQVEVQGTVRASVEDVQELVRREVSITGVWKADLEELSTKLERLPWIRRAVVSRVLPDVIRVRIAEREPRAVVRTASGRFRWVDDDAVLLGEMDPADPVPAFFLRGLSEEDSEDARRDNVGRVRKFLELQREYEAAGISERISEINLTDRRDVRVQLAGEDARIEVRLGAQDSGRRLTDGLAVLDEHRSGPRGHLISYVDLSQRKGAAIGFVSGAHTAATAEGYSEGRNQKADAPRDQNQQKKKEDRATVEQRKRDAR